jgi:hypothetical protein
MASLDGTLLEICYKVFALVRLGDVKVHVVAGKEGVRGSD